MATVHATQKRRRGGAGHLAWLVLGACLLLGAAFSARAYALKRIAIAIPQPTTTNPALEGDVEGFNDGPAMSTFSDVDRALEKVHELIQDNRFDLAAWHLQKTLDDQFKATKDPSSDQDHAAVITRNEWRTPDLVSGDPPQRFQLYKSVNVEVERIIRELSPDALAVYRIESDAETERLMAKAAGPDEESYLTEAVQRLFLTSLGDDAAYRLGCLRLENRDYVGASRMFRKILEEYPKPSVSRDEVLLRLAVASARLGDRPEADRALRQISSNGVPRRALELVSQDVTYHATTHTANVSQGGQWLMRLGEPSRKGVMPAPKFEPELRELREHLPNLKQFNMGLTATGNVSPPNVAASQQKMIRGRMVRFGGSYVAPNQARTTPNRPSLIDRWRKMQWSPASRALMYKGNVYFKTYEVPPSEHAKEGAKARLQLKCIDMATGHLKWERSWFKLNRTAATNNTVRRYNRTVSVAGNKPSTYQEIASFGDRIGHAISIIDGVVYSLEGSLGTPTITYNQWGQPSTANNRTNTLFAYDAISGKILWTRTGDIDPETKSPDQLQFAAAPVPYGDMLIVPARDNGALWLYAFRPQGPKKGEFGEWKIPTVWKTYLCDKPPAGVDPNSSVGVAVEGGDVYVGSGAGVVFAVDAASGGIRWADRYKRSGGQVQTANRFGRYVPSGQSIKGWAEDTVIPHGRMLIVLPSDSQWIYGFDRRTGKFAWAGDAKPSTDDNSVTGGPINYCLGVHGDYLYVGGPTEIRCYSIPGEGRRVAHASSASSFLGRAVLTNDGIFVAEEDSIVHVSLYHKDKEQIRREKEYQVPSAGSDPIGNLYSSGDGLVALGVDRIRILTSVERIVRQLNERVKKGDLVAHRERVRMLDRKGQLDEAIADLKRFVEATRLAGEKEAQEDPELEPKAYGQRMAIVALTEGILDLGLPTRSPVAAVNLMGDTPQDWDKVDLPDTARHARSRILFDSLNQIGQNRSPTAVTALLKIIPHCRQPSLLTAAQKALSESASREHLDILRAAIKSPQPPARTAAIVALARLQGDKAAEELKGLLEDRDENIQMTAARALANTGSRQSLAALLRLLESKQTVIRAQAAGALRFLTGQGFGFVAYGDAKGRQEAVAKWKKWVAENGEKAKLNFPIRDAAIRLGRTLICNYLEGQVIELATGDDAPIFLAEDVRDAFGCQGLPNGHRLVVSRDGRYVAEYDRVGKEVWRVANLPGTPVSVRRLENEHTLMALASSNQVLEVDPKGARPWQHKFKSGSPADAHRLKNDLTLVALSNEGRVVEIDREGNVKWELNDLQQPRAVQRLENGNTLVVENGGAKVVEYTRDKKAVWTKDKLRSPFDAQRLPNGNTLVVDATGVYEFTREGKVVWTKKMQGLSRVYRY